MAVSEAVGSCKYTAARGGTGVQGGVLCCTVLDTAVRDAQGAHGGVQSEEGEAVGSCKYTAAPGVEGHKGEYCLYCTVLYCTVLHCTVLYCTVLYCTGLDCTVHGCQGGTRGTRGSPVRGGRACGPVCSCMPIVFQAPLPLTIEAVGVLVVEQVELRECRTGTCQTGMLSPAHPPSPSLHATGTSSSTNTSSMTGRTLSAPAALLYSYSMRVM